MGKDDKEKDPIAERLAELDRLIAEQKARLEAASVQQASGGITAEQLAAVLATANAAQKEIAEQSRQVRHSNADHLHISAFSHPEGDLKAPKARLKRETYFNGHREREEDLTPQEIDAYNAIEHSCEARDGRWKARVESRRLLIDVPSKTPDDRMDLPQGLVLILRELALGKRAADPAEMANRLAALERLMADKGLAVPA